MVENDVFSDLWFNLSIKLSTNFNLKLEFELDSNLILKSYSELNSRLFSDLCFEFKSLSS